MGDTQSKGTVYVCGPMRNMPQHNFPLFYQASAMLELWGYDVINPAKMDIDEGRAHFNHNTKDVILDNSFKMENAMRRDFKVILGDCDAIIVLPGWDNSDGGQREVAFGLSIGLSVFEMPVVANHPLDITSDKPMDIFVLVDCHKKDSVGPQQCDPGWSGDLGETV